MLEQEEVAAMAKRLGVPLNKRQLKAAMADMDEDGSGEVNFEEFLLWWRAQRATGCGGGGGGASKLGRAVMLRWSSEALQLLRSAMSVLTRNGHYKEEWAQCQIYAAATHSTRAFSSDGLREIGRRTALECYALAQVVFSKEFYPAKWAVIEAAKGDLMRGEGKYRGIARHKNNMAAVSKMISCFSESLRAFDRSEKEQEWNAVRDKLSSTKHQWWQERVPQ